MNDSSYRTILRSSSIIGGSQVVNIAAGFAKMKGVALLLGPAGVGLVGLYLAIVQTGSTVAALGFGNIGTRQIAAARADGGDEAVAGTRRALFWGTLALGLLGAGFFVLAIDPIARTFLGDAERSKDVAWLSIAVLLTVAAGSQAALLTGLRRIGDLARVKIGAGLAGAILGVAAIWLCGEYGLIAMVIVGPAVTFLLGLVFVAKLERPVRAPFRWQDLRAEWSILVRLGFAFMLSGLVVTLGQLIARTFVQRALGLDALGQFQASWAIGMTYMGLVLGAMGTDYYPRLTAAIDDRAAACRIVNEQTEVALLLCAPPLLAMLALAPWLIRLLYSAEFAPAVDILRWQLIGDVLKVLSWPMGFVLLARGAGKTYVGAQSLGIGMFLLAVYLGLPVLGVAATGIGFIALYAILLPVNYWLAHRLIGLAWSRAVKHQAKILLSCALVLHAIARWSEIAGAVVGCVLAVCLALAALSRLATMTGAEGHLGRLARVGERMTFLVRRWP